MTEAGLDYQAVQVEAHSVATPHGNLAARRFFVEGAHGIPLLVLHGGPGLASDYLEPFSQLASDRPVILFDQIGCGGSDQPVDDSVWDVAVYVQHVELVRAHFGLDAIHLYGQSWGGFLALAYSDAHPDHVATVVLGSPLVDTQRWVADAAELIDALDEPFRSALQAGPNDPGYAAAEAEYYRRHFCRLDPWPAVVSRGMESMDRRSYETMWGPNEFTSTDGVLHNQSMAPAAARLTVPNLWVTGSDDEATPQSVREFAASNDLSEVVVVPDATHCAHFEDPETYFGAIRSFLITND